MSKYIHNTSEITKTYQGREVLPSSFLIIPPSLYGDFAEDNEILSDIINGSITISLNTIPESTNIANSIALLAVTQFRSSVAIDKNGINQYISEIDPVVVVGDRLLWDLNEDYDLSTEDLVVPLDGIYSFDIQLKVSNLSNVSSVELAIYKRGEPDDYWFILEKKDVGSLSELQLNNTTSFDFYSEERYCLKIILTKILPLISCSCTIEGNDDYSAWGFNLEYAL